jgi:hypothetical protein
MEDEEMGMVDEMSSSSSSNLGAFSERDLADLSGEGDPFPPGFNPTPTPTLEMPQEYMDKAGEVWDTVADGAEKVWDDVTNTAANVWDSATGDADTEQVPPDFYETLSPEDKETYDLLPNHGGLGRDPNDHGIY